jgi:hypothetical protein
VSRRASPYPRHANSRASRRTPYSGSGRERHSADLWSSTDEGRHRRRLPLRVRGGSQLRPFGNERRVDARRGPARRDADLGMAYLEAHAATADAYYLEAASDVACALVRGQYCSGGWNYYIEFDPSKRKEFRYHADGGCAREAGATDRPTTLDSQAAHHQVQHVRGGCRAPQRVPRRGPAVAMTGACAPACFRPTSASPLSVGRYRSCFLWWHSRERTRFSNHIPETRCVPSCKSTLFRGRRRRRP